MKIGIAGPISLRLLHGLENRLDLPAGYEHPPMSALVNALLKSGRNVTVFTSSPGLKEPIVVTERNLTVCIARRERRAAREFFRSVRTELIDFMKAYPTDIINSHWTYEFSWAALDSGVPVLVTLRDHAPTVLRYSRSMYWVIRLLISHYVINRANFLSTNSSYLLDRLSVKQKRKAVVTQNFFADSLVDHYNPYRQRQGNIVCISNGFGRLKNVKSAIQAFGLIDKQLRGMQLLLIGFEMGEGESAENYAREQGLSANIKFLGRLPHGEAIELVRNAKVVLHPSLEESFGMSVLEAMVVGTPVVGGISSGNIPNLLRNGSVGTLCDVGNPRDIADAVVGIVRNENDAAEMALVAHKHAVDKYSEDVAIANYVDQYRKVIQGGTPNGL